MISLWSLLHHWLQNQPQNILMLRQVLLQVSFQDVGSEAVITYSSAELFTGCDNDVTVKTSGSLFNLMEHHKIIVLLNIRQPEIFQCYSDFDDKQQCT